ncbi:peptidase M50B-like-domain-containing protein [Hyaloraphidium curvatum]|nr:peptidase M50B-like-domain-containing protein [Hyaloraphidium curvatum]
MAPLVGAGAAPDASELGAALLAGATQLHNLAARQVPTDPGSSITYQWTHLTDATKYTLYFLAGFFVAILILWPIPYLNLVLYPFKLVTISFHEFGHASAAWLTGGRVTGITVEPNLGGKTEYRGGVQAIILPAGYIGSCFWGSIMVFAAFDALATRIVSLIICVLLLIVIVVAKNWLPRLLNAFFIAVICVLWWLSTTQYDPNGYGLRAVTLWFGVMSSMYALWDIIEDLVTRRVNASDATQFAKMCGKSCAATAQCWGVIWFMISLAFLGLAIFGGVTAFNRAPYPPI